jgi:hypothetical protein
MEEYALNEWWDVSCHELLREDATNLKIDIGLLKFQSQISLNFI